MKFTLEIDRGDYLDKKFEKSESGKQVFMVLTGSDKDGQEYEIAELMELGRGYRVDTYLGCLLIGMLRALNTDLLRVICPEAKIKGDTK